MKEATSNHKAASAAFPPTNTEHENGRGPWYWVRAEAVTGPEEPVYHLSDGRGGMRCRRDIPGHVVKEEPRHPSRRCLRCKASLFAGSRFTPGPWTLHGHYGANKDEIGNTARRIATVWTPRNISARHPMSAAGPKKEFDEARSTSDLLRLFAEKIEDLERDLTGEAKKFINGEATPRVPHTCRESRTCCCDKRADTPSEDCPQHGPGPWPPRCELCGRLLPWSVRDRKGNAAEPPTESISDRNARIDNDMRNTELGRDDGPAGGCPEEES